MNDLSNGDSAPYWEAAKAGRLVVQKCSGCGNVQFPPRHQCAKCWSPELAWLDCSGRGVVESFTIVRRAPAAEFIEKAPYAVVAVLLEEGPRMITGMNGEGALDISIGDPVEVAFEARGDGRVLPVFQPVTQNADA